MGAVRRPRLSASRSGRPRGPDRVRGGPRPAPGAQPVGNRRGRRSVHHDRAGGSGRDRALSRVAPAGGRMTGGAACSSSTTRTTSARWRGSSWRGAGYEVVVARLGRGSADAGARVVVRSRAARHQHARARRLGDAPAAARRRGARTTLPVAMFSVKSEVRDKVAGLKDGAIDYITKPFGVDELVSRRVAHSRSAPATAPRGPNRLPTVRPMDAERPKTRSSTFATAISGCGARSTTGRPGFPPTRCSSTSCARSSTRAATWASSTSSP